VVLAEALRQHMAVVTQARNVSAGVVAAAMTTKTTSTETDKTTTTTTTFTVTAKRWKHGWELHIDGVGVSQSKTLAIADQMVRDYIETLTDQDVSNAEVIIIPELGALGKNVSTVRAQVEEAERAQREASAAKRQLAEDLRSAGLSVSDTAAILGVSRGRVSQLISKAS
jgi:hypothetical protein